MSLSEEEISSLKQSFKRCRPEVLDAVIKFRNEGDKTAVPIVINGIIERYLPPESTVNLDECTDDTRLQEDLGIDSLTMLEIVMSIEEAMGLRVEDSELASILTMGDVKHFLDLKLGGGTGVESKSAGSKRYTKDDLMLLLPQQHPFQFVDEVRIDGDNIEADYTPAATEFFFEGHFKDDPVLPATIVFEALGQACCLWVLEHAPSKLNIEIPNNQVVFASMSEAHFFRRVKPEEKVQMEAKLLRLRSPLAVFSGKVSVNGEKVCHVDEITLAFGDMEQLVEKAEKSEESADSGSDVAGQ